CETLGWLSEGHTAQDAQNNIKQYRANQKVGNGPTSLAEERELQLKAIEQKRKAQEEAEAQQKLEEKRNISFNNYWSNHYLPHIKETKKTQSWKTEQSLYKLWIHPKLGKLKFYEIAPLHLRSIKKKMADNSKSPATIRMAFCVIQQLWNMAQSDGHTNKPSPTKDKQAGMPTKKNMNNLRERFLTPEEAEKLLAALKLKSERLHDIALLSLHTGMRASEVFSLTWDCINFEQGNIRLLDTKTSSPRTVPLTHTAQRMLAQKKTDSSTNLVFPAREGKQSQWVSKTFRDVVKDLGLNHGITDRRKRIVFHSLRHSCASFLVQNGVPIFTVSEILGHSSLDMTKRYAHLHDEHKKKSISAVEKALKKRG
ncbi:MAG: site-specific integrase, partial [Candidatus Bathyarchaeota archaeon]|nr:site-specific integrase [Candidatus Bathyarchaeum sp.]